MKTPIEQLREKDAWIAEHVFGWKWYLFSDHICQLEAPSNWQERHGGNPVDIPRDTDEKDTTSVDEYTTDPAASDALDDKILEKLDGGYAIFRRKNGSFHMTGNRNQKFIEAEHHDKKICRVLFAEKLFGK